MSSRRTVLSLLSTSVIGGFAGCSDVRASGKPAHTVSVYLGDRKTTHDLTVTINEDDGTVVFERTYSLSDDNEAHEDATFPESTNPQDIVLTVDGNQFARPWPEPTDPSNQCSEGNWQGIEIWVEGGPDEPPSIRLVSNCQHVTLS